MDKLNSGESMSTGVPVYGFMIQHTIVVLCRIRFGSNNLYIFRHPLVAEDARRQHKDITLFTYEDAQEEIARNSGLDFSNGNVLRCYLTYKYSKLLHVSVYL